MSDEMKTRAMPRINKLIAEAYENEKKLDISNALADIQITLLARLCELKEDQRDGEDKRHRLWLVKEAQASKKRGWDMKASLWVLGVAVVGLSLDVIKIDSEGIFVTWLINFIS